MCACLYVYVCACVRKRMLLWVPISQEFIYSGRHPFVHSSVEQDSTKAWRWLLCPHLLFPAKSRKKMLDEECDYVCKGTVAIWAWYCLRNCIILVNYQSEILIEILRIPLPSSFSQVILLGESGVGKSNLLSCYTRNMFNLKARPTVGVDFDCKILEIESKAIKAYIWDTGL